MATFTELVSTIAVCILCFTASTLVEMGEGDDLQSLIYNSVQYRWREDESKSNSKNLCFSYLVEINIDERIHEGPNQKRNN